MSARDGVRFLVSIMRAAAIYRPARPLLLFAALFAWGAAAPGRRCSGCAGMLEDG
jgi:hypothetical protein